MFLAEALMELGLHNLGLDIGETFQSVCTYQIIEIQYHKAMLEALGGTSKVQAKRNVLRIRAAYLELKGRFVEPGVSISESEERVADSVPLVIDLTKDCDTSSRKDGKGNSSNQLDQMIGVRVKKNMWFKGKVTCIWSNDDEPIPLWKRKNWLGYDETIRLWKRKNWHVEYEDGDEEDLIWQELTKCPKDDLCDRELGDEGYTFWKQFKLVGTVTKIHHFKGREPFFQVEYDDFLTDEIFTMGELDVVM